MDKRHDATSFADDHLTPLDKTEQFYQNLLSHYANGDDKELRAASKLLLVALEKFQCHGGPAWYALMYEYINIAIHEPEKFELILQQNRSSTH
ncbi:hypothetical protein [Neptunomonas phycophila]|jgi:hypothetical protein|uniref:hypothetical protein n=1 Tax=Neptunomonas phycophila TaxID=1572645 RepID=UPI0023F6EAAC|nr:hypothetical protein [Neptunomonas phycophila]